MKYNINKWMEMVNGYINKIKGINLIFYKNS